MANGTKKLIYRMAEAELDPLSGQVKRNGDELYLRPKTLQVLLYLIEQRPRLIPKEELMDQIWQGTAVTDDALVQSIVEIRRALGENSQQPRFIKTFPKTGYRFIGEVEVDTGTLAVEQITSVEIEYEEVVETGETAIERRNEQTPDARRSMAPSLRRPVVVGAVAFALLLPLGAYLYRNSRTARGSAAEIVLPRVPGKRTVAVMYFENQSGDRELDWLREGLADMLIVNLSRSRGLTLLSRQQLDALLDHIGYGSASKIRLEDGQEVGRRAQAEVLIFGRFARLGEQIRIDVTLHEARSGQIQAAETLLVERPGLILAQIDLLSLKLASHLNAAFTEQNTQRGLAAMTNSLDAFRYYSLALEQAQMFQFREALALLDKALALDPQFALANARIGYIYAVRMGQGEQARPYLETALSLADRLSEKDKLYVRAWLAHAARDTARVIEMYRELNTRYPLETEAYQRLAWVLESQQRNQEALAVIRQGLLTDAEWKDLYNVLGAVCMRLGRNEEALAAFQRFVQLAPADPNAWDSLGLFHQWLGQYAEAEAAYNRALTFNPESGVAILHLGHLRFQQGRYSAASQQYRRFIQVTRDDNAQARGFTFLAWVYAKQGDVERAAAATKEEVRHNPASAWNSLALVLHRREQATVDELSKTVFSPANYDLSNERGVLRIWEYQRGQVALRQGRAEESLNHFRAAVHYRAVEWNIDSFEDCLANALLELGRNDEAIAEYERILKINPHYPLAHYRLGQAYEHKGDREQARAAYQRFLQVWQGADAQIAELVEARQRLNAL
ncbi:MAG: tetratricopeptide repeat protein [Acidobacteriota bacterium]